MKNNNGKIGNTCTNKERKDRGTKIAKEVVKRLNTEGIFIKSDSDKELLRSYLFLVFSGDMTIDEAIALISEIIVMREAKTQKIVNFYNDYIP